MKFSVDLDQVRVVQADNYKGNSRVYLEIMDTRVLYSDPWKLAHDEMYKYYVKTEDNPPTVDTDSLADLFRYRLRNKLAAWLLEDEDIAMAWSTDTDREINGHKPRFEQLDEYDF
jgi:hypothetical protein